MNQAYLREFFLGLAVVGWAILATYLRYAGHRWLAPALLGLALVGGGWAVGNRLFPADQAQPPERVYHRHLSLKTRLETWVDAHLAPYFLSLACPRRAVPAPSLNRPQDRPRAQGDLWEEYQRRQKQNSSSPSSLLRELARAGERRRVYPKACWEKARGYAELALVFVGGFLFVLLCALAGTWRGRNRKREQR